MSCRIRNFALAACAAARTCRHGASRPWPDHAARRKAFRPQDRRPDLDHGVHHARSRLHDLRHAVRDRCQWPDQAADDRHKYELSADSLTWTMTLRDGLLWHDGTPVTAEDCVASIRRWAARDAMGQKLMTS